MLKKREGSHTLQRTPHATLPCAMTGQDRVNPSTPAYKYGENKGGGLGRDQDFKGSLF